MMVARCSVLVVAAAIVAVLVWQVSGCGGAGQRADCGCDDAVERDARGDAGGEKSDAPSSADAGDGVDRAGPSSLRVDLRGLDADARKRFLATLDVLPPPCASLRTQGVGTLAACLPPQTDEAGTKPEDMCKRCDVAQQYVLRLVRADVSASDIAYLYEHRFQEEHRWAIDHAQIGKQFASMREGPEDASVKMVVWSDFECPFCAEGHAVLRELLKAFPTQIQITFLQFPLRSIHPMAESAARAAVAASKQGHHTSYAERLFARQGQFSEAVFVEIAKELGMKTAQFRRDSRSQATAGIVETQRALGEALGVKGTPTLVIDQRRYLEPWSELPKYIEELMLEHAPSD